MINSLLAISPIDGRYRNKVQNLEKYFSEYALIQYRLKIEVEYIISLIELPLVQLSDFPKEKISLLRSWYQNFSIEDAEKIKATELVTNHDVKAVEYFLKDKFEANELSKYKEFIHFGLTSQDINNTAIPLSLKNYNDDYFFNQLENLIESLKLISIEWKDIPMLARTHGQAASPTLLGKEIFVFVNRIEKQLSHLKAISLTAKFGGATGNMNAHYVSYPEVDWKIFATNFVVSKLNLSHSYPTTQIDHYDELANYFDCVKRINTILIDFCRDIWTYISIDYFKQKLKASEVGSSAMPHKVNPIDFENAEGNLGLANALFEHLSSKLPISRLQRDLTDSTVLRNIGVPLAHTALAIQSIDKGLSKLILNQEAINSDLEKNWAVVAEAIQTILRRENFDQPYEALKALTRGNQTINQKSIHLFIDSLQLNENIKLELKSITPFNYVGKFSIHF